MMLVKWNETFFYKIAYAHTHHKMHTQKQIKKRPHNKELKAYSFKFNNKKIFITLNLPATHAKSIQNTIKEVYF